MLHVPIGSNTFGLTQPSTTARPATAQGDAVTPDPYELVVYGAGG